MKVAILGTGAYGLALAISFFKNTQNIMMWTKLDSELEELTKYGTNKRVLSDTVMPKEIKYTNALKMLNLLL